MKNKIILIILIITFVSDVCYGYNEINSDYGIKAWLSEDHTNPIISMVITFEKAGYAYDDKSGLSAIVAKSLKEGAGKYDAATIADMLESNGIILNYDVSLENFIVRIKTLSDKFDTALLLLQSMLTEPHFDEQAIERIKSQQLTIIKKSQEDPSYVARRKFFEVAFESHPYMNQPHGTVEGIEKITRKDLLAYVEQFLNRVNLNIAISGDINSEKLSKILDRHLMNLPLTSKEIKEISTITALKAPNPGKISLHMGIPQSIVYFGKYGVDLHDPNFYSAYLLNHIIGGRSLDSILMDEIRKKRGLTYGIYMWLEDYAHANLLLGTAATDNTSEHEMLLAINEIFENVKRDGISVERLQNAKDYIINSFITKLDTNDKISESLAYAQNNKLGLNYPNDFCKNINNVTLQDVNKIANSLLDTKKMFFVTVGKTKDKSQ